MAQMAVSQGREKAISEAVRGERRERESTGGELDIGHCSQYELKCLPGLYQDQISLLTVTSNINRAGDMIFNWNSGSQVFTNNLIVMKS